MLPFLFLQSLANDVARELVIECDILYPLKLGTDPVKKIRDCFFKADESKMLNCVSASAVAPHIEASIKRNQ